MLPARRTTTCASPIYPPAVIQSVTEQMRAYYNNSMQQQQQQQPHKEDSDEAAADARVREQRTMIPESAACIGWCTENDAGQALPAAGQSARRGGTYQEASEKELRVTGGSSACEWMDASLIIIIISFYGLLLACSSYIVFCHRWWNWKSVDQHAVLLVAAVRRRFWTRPKTTR